MRCPKYDKCHNHDKCYQCGVQSDILNHYPLFQSKDLVEVIRCKDCKHWESNYGYCMCHGLDEYGDSAFGENSFCSRAERKKK